MSRYFNKCRQSLVQEMWTSEAQHKQYLAIYFPRSTTHPHQSSLAIARNVPTSTRRASPRRSNGSRTRSSPLWVVSIRLSGVQEIEAGLESNL
jgi:hypothetical protein